MNALEALKKIRDYVGICGNVEELTEETMPYELKELIVEWPANAAKLHSLRQNYPVEGTGDEYELSAEAGTLWNHAKILRNYRSSRTRRQHLWQCTVFDTMRLLYPGFEVGYPTEELSK